MMNSFSNNWQISCTKSLKDYLRETLLMDKVESSASDVVIEMECLEKVEKELCQKEVNKKDIRIYVNELNAAACDETPLIENKSTKKVRETPYFIEWQSPIVEWLNPIRDWQAPLSEYQENLFEWYVPYGNFGNIADGEGLGEEDIFQP